MEIWHRKCRIKNPRRQTMPKKSLGKKEKKLRYELFKVFKAKPPYTFPYTDSAQPNIFDLICLQAQK